MRGLYIHIPFCVKKCKYCDFISYAGREAAEEAYITAAIEEMKQYEGEEIDTVFIGGGTPTVLNGAQLTRLISMCFKLFNIVHDYEFTVEANPGTVDREKAFGLLDAGVNRISVGVQSFNDSELNIIGRIHSAKTAYDSIIELKEAGFSNISIDIMTALPYQNGKTLAKTLETAVSLPITHISAYSLIIEDNTALKAEYDAGKLILADDDADREMYAMTKAFLEKNGFLRYEISNFSKKGFECRHNIKYWECEEYIGIGAAASSYFMGKRYTNARDLDRYLKGERHEQDGQELTLNDKMSEFMMLGLRMDKGIDSAEFKKRFGQDIGEVYGAELEKFTKMKLLIHDGGIYRFSQRGLDVSNSVLCEFML